MLASQGFSVGLDDYQRPVTFRANSVKESARDEPGTRVGA